MEGDVVMVVEGASPERKKRERSPRRVQVRVVHPNRGALVLVEWVTRGDDWARGFVPREAVEDGAVGDDVLALAASYGIPWEEIIEVDVTAAKVARALRQRDVWTEDDLRTKPRAVVEAYMDVCRPDVAGILAKIDTRKVGG